MKYYNYVFSDEGNVINSYGTECKHYEVKNNIAHILEPYVNSFKDGRQEGIKLTLASHNFDPKVYETILLSGKTYEIHQTQQKNSMMPLITVKTPSSQVHLS